MTKNLLQIFVFTSVVFTQINAQVTIFSEDFEAASGPENIANGFLGWQNAQLPTNPTTDNNYFWVLDNTRCNVISGTHSMAVSTNIPATTATLPQYQTNRKASTLAYYTTPINATNHSNLALDFNWICEGEAGQDYGYILYSFDANNWATLPGTYEGQNTVQNVTNLDLSVLDGQTFYLGFGWNNDNSGGTFPGFTVDDIDVKGTPLPTCTAPVPPTDLNLTATNNSINGFFTAAAPVPDNYLAIVSTNSTAPIPVDGTNYNVGDTIGTGTVADTDANTTLTATGLTGGVTYYIYVYSYNTIQCTGGPIYSTNYEFAIIQTTNSSFCTPITQNIPSLLYIDDVQFLGTLNDVNNLGNGFSASPSGYQDFRTSVTNSFQAQGQGINIFVGSNTARGHYKAWVDWNNDGTFNNDASELVYDSGGVLTATTTFGFVIPTNQAIGDYRIRIRFNNAYSDRHQTELGSYTYDSCEPFINHDFNGQNNDYTDYGEAEDYLFTVVESCSAEITSVTDGSACGPGSANLQVTGNATASDFNWYANETDGIPIATSSTFTPVISATTTYWVTATDGRCESLKRIPVTATLNPITVLTITTTTPNICGENDVIEIAASGSTELAYLIDEDFEGGGTGVFSIVNVNNNFPAENSLSQWQNQTSTFVPNQQVWYPAISSGFGSNQFVMATSDINPSETVWTALKSPILDSSTFTDLTLTFDMYFSKYSPDPDATLDNVYVWASIDGGANFNLLQNISADIGIGTNFDKVNVDLSAYVNKPNLIISIDYVAGWMDGVAIDNVQLFGSRPLSPSFTWTGSPEVDAYTDEAATTPYVSGSSISKVYIKPTLEQLELAAFDFTATASLSNGCDIDKLITLTNKTQIWKGTTNTDWNTANNWSGNSVPDATKCIIIRNGDHPSIDGTTDAEGYDLLIKNGATLTQQSNSALFIENNIHVEASGIYNMLDSASLVQKDNVANTVDGTFTMQRIATMRQNDYVYWSSPVTSFNIENISPGTPNGYKYIWIPTMFQGIGPPGNMDFGDWQGYNTGAMDIAKGYIIKGQTDHPNSSSPFSATFNGVPNNGTIVQAIERGDYTANPYSFQPNSGGDLLYITAEDDNWNLIGNPYPSAINAVEFLAANANIDGVVYLWTHGTDISAENPDPFYDDFEYNYNVADYLAYNASGSSIQNGFNGNIGAGQGFFVLMNDIGLSSENVTFENTMRNSVYGNNEFYRDSDIPDQSATNKHRIWLDFISASGETNTTLVAYVDGATNSEDRMYDAKNSKGNGLNLYSLIDDKSYIIQGRELPFTNSDVVPIGMNITESGIQTIAINSVEGLFENLTQDIFLEDVINGTIHNLSASPYMFTSEPGIINNRFILKYTNSSLTTDEYNSLNGITVFDKNDTLVVKSAYAEIQSIQVFDILGRNLFANKSIHVNRFIINSMVRNKSTLFLKIELTDGKQKIAKIIF